MLDLVARQVGLAYSLFLLFAYFWPLFSLEMAVLGGKFASSSARKLHDAQIISVRKAFESFDD